MNNYNQLKNRIKKNEGYKSEAYKDDLGFKTIGFGHLIKKKEKLLLNNIFTKKYLSLLFEEDFQNALNDYKKIYRKKNHPKEIKEIFIEMIYQLGIEGQKKFLKMNKYIEQKKFFMAAYEMKKSLWYKQTPKRVDGLINFLLKRIYEKK